MSKFHVTFTYFWYFQIPYCMYCLLFKFISPNFCQNLYVYNLHDFILTGGGTASPQPRTAIISRCYGTAIYCVKNILTLLFLMTFADSRLFILDSRLFTLSRLSTFTLDSRLLLSTLDFYSRLSTFKYTLYTYSTTNHLNLRFVLFSPCLQDVGILRLLFNSVLTVQFLKLSVRWFRILQLMAMQITCYTYLRKLKFAISRLNSKTT